MQNFFNALTSETKNINIPDEYDYFGKLVGSWKIKYIDNNNSMAIDGEWHFSWILGGMAIQDVIVLPNFEYGTTLRIYNPTTNAWDIAYGYTGKMMRLEARKCGGKVILTSLDDKSRKWVFVKIEENNFHWQDIRVKDNGEWQINFELFAERM